MKRKLFAVLLSLSLPSMVVAAQAKREGPTKILVPNGADVDGLEIDQDDAGQNALTITDGGFVLDLKTLAQLNALTPVTTGQAFLCSDCTQSTICISSGVLPGAFVVAVGTGVFAGSSWSQFPHCR